MLAGALSGALTRWGAGKRGAPSCQPISNIAAALNNTTLHANLANLEASLPYLAINSNLRRLNPGSPFKSVSDFDKCLLDTLHQISNQILVGNTNVTYPMKSILLITGLMPAFDSQVKGGLAVAGVTGVNKTRYAMPMYGSADAKKICSLPFYIAECVSRCSPTINREVAASNYPDLIGEHGRIFDILFFMQNGVSASSAVVQFSPPTGIRWYDI